MTTSTPTPVPGSMNITAYQNAAQSFLSSPVLDAITGSPVDFTSYTGLTAAMSPLAPNPCTADVSIGSVSGTNAGVLTLALAANALNSYSPGAARLLVRGTPASGGGAQLLIAGTITVNPG